MPYQQPFLDIALNALTQEQLIQHLRERLLEKDKLTQEIEELKKENAELGEENTYMKNVPCPPVDENEKLKKEIEKLKKENEELKMFNEWNNQATLKWNDAKDEIEKLKKEKEELERFNDRLEEKIEKIQDPVLHDRDIRGDNFDIRVCYGYIQECIERITGEYDDGELDDSVYREVAQSIDVGINNFVKNGTIGSIQELECAITEAIEKDPVYNKIVKEDEEEDEKNQLETKFQVWRETMIELNPQYSVDEEIGFLRNNTDDETIVKKLFDELYSEKGWVYNLETHGYDITEG